MRYAHLKLDVPLSASDMVTALGLAATVDIFLARNQAYAFKESGKLQGVYVSSFAADEPKVDMITAVYVLEEEDLSRWMAL